MPQLICYDIACNKKRLKVANKLLEYGLERVQYSVFLGNMSPRKLGALKKILEKLDTDVLTTDDSIIIFEISLAKIKKMTTFGVLGVDIDDLMGLNHTLYFQ